MPHSSRSNPQFPSSDKSTPSEFVSVLLHHNDGKNGSGDRADDVRLASIWTDALSINQANKQEKSLQVRNTKQVYAKAEATYVWLGPSSYDSALSAMQFPGRVASNISILKNKPLLACRCQRRSSRGNYLGVRTQYSYRGPSLSALPGGIVFPSTSQAVITLTTSSLRSGKDSYDEYI